MTYRTAGIIFFLVSTMAFGVFDTTAIDKVIKKEVLDQQDLAVIDSFVASGISEILNTQNFSTIGNVRLDIVARAHSGQSGADIQYHPQFIAAAAKNLEKAFSTAAKISDPDRRLQVKLNLMILLDNLGDVKLAEIALKMTDTDDSAVRYWAVHSLTNKNIIEQFNTGKASAALARTICERLAAVIKNENSAYIFSQIVQFAYSLNIPQAQELFTQIIDMRLSKYQTWTADNFQLDEMILQLLSEKAASDKAVAQKFAQLYAYAMELYIKDGASLNKTQKQQLALLLVQTEARSLPKLLGILQSGVKKAIDKGSQEALQSEYTDLFGDGTKAGKLGVVCRPLPEKPKATK